MLLKFLVTLVKSVRLDTQSTDTKLREEDMNITKCYITKQNQQQQQSINQQYFLKNFFPYLNTYFLIYIFGTSQSANIQNNRISLFFMIFYYYLHKVLLFNKINFNLTTSHVLYIYSKDKLNKLLFFFVIKPLKSI